MKNVAEIIMERFDERDAICVALIGAGPLSSRLAAQIAGDLPGIVMVVADRDLDAPRRSVVEATFRVPRVIESVFGLRLAIEAGESAITRNWQLLCESPLIDAVVEVTGETQWADEIVRLATAAGKHVIATTNPRTGTHDRDIPRTRVQLIRTDIDAASLPEIRDASSSDHASAIDGGSHAARP